MFTKHSPRRFEDHDVRVEITASGLESRRHRPSQSEFRSNVDSLVDHEEEVFEAAPSVTKKIKSEGPFSPAF